MDEITKWYTFMVTLENMLNQISADDYPTLRGKIDSANDDVKALLKAAIG